MNRNETTRITLHMTMMDIFMALSKEADGSGNNPGAIRVVTDLYQQAGRIDRAAALGGLGALLELDSNGIYGHRIWTLFKDVCGESMEKLVAVLRASQLSYTNVDEINQAIDSRNQDKKLDVEKLLAKVKERLKHEWVSP